MVHERFKDIDTFILDVDGVLTDGTLLITEEGQFLRRMNVRDGLVLKMAEGLGYRITVITGGGSKGVKERLTFLGAHPIYEKVHNKLQALEEMINDHGINPETSLYIGDDLADVVLKGKVSILCTPADGVPEMKACADYICEKNGGSGCVREVMERVLKARGHWPDFS